MTWQCVYITATVRVPRPRARRIYTAACMQAWARRTEKQRQDLQEADRELYAELFDHYNNRYESINSGVR